MSEKAKKDLKSEENHPEDWKPKRKTPDGDFVKKSHRNSPKAMRKLK